MSTLEDHERRLTNLESDVRENARILRKVEIDVAKILDRIENFAPPGSAEMCLYQTQRTEKAEKEIQAIKFKVDPHDFNKMQESIKSLENTRSEQNGAKLALTTLWVAISGFVGAIVSYYLSNHRG